MHISHANTCWAKWIEFGRKFQKKKIDHVEFKANEELWMKSFGEKVQPFYTSN